MKLFGLDERTTEAKRLARCLGLDLAAHEERVFEDTEFKIRPLESVRGQHVFVYHSLYADANESSSDKFCRLLFFAGALKDASAEKVTAIVPYLAYSRKDRRTKARDPVTTRYVAQLLEGIGIDVVVTADIHNLAAFENAFRCEKINVEAAAVIVEHFAPIVVDAGRVVVLSPDSGGVKRARAFADLMSRRLARDVDLAFMEKHRSEGSVSGDLFAGDVRNATIIVLDDLISGGTTMARAAEACKERGAIAVHAAATHGLFAKVAGKKLSTASLDSIVVTDTIGDAGERCPELRGKLVVLESANLFAEAVRRLVG